MINIVSKSYNVETGELYVDCVAALPSGTRTGVVVLTLPEDASDQELQDAIVKLYEPVA